MERNIGIAMASQRPLCVTFILPRLSVTGGGHPKQHAGSDNPGNPVKAVGPLSAS